MIVMSEYDVRELPIPRSSRVRSNSSQSGGRPLSAHARSHARDSHEPRGAGRMSSFVVNTMRKKPVRRASIATELTSTELKRRKEERRREELEREKRIRKRNALGHKYDSGTSPVVSKPPVSPMRRAQSANGPRMKKYVVCAFSALCVESVCSAVYSCLFVYVTTNLCHVK